MPVGGNIICLLIHSLQPGGMERVMSELANYFCRKPNTHVHLIMYGIKPVIFYKLPDTVCIHTPPFIFNNDQRVVSTLRTMAFLRKEIKRINPSTILSFGEYFNSLVLLAIFGLKFPVYISDRCQPDKSLGRFHDLLRRLLYPKATGVIVQTVKAKEIYKKLLSGTNITVIGNPIHHIDTTTVIEKEDIVLTVGRLIKSKHHDDLIKVFADINIPGWKLVLVGDDAVKQQNMKGLKNLATRLGIQNSIVFTGSRNDVDEFYRRSKIFAFTSSSEGFPNVLGEAMTAGLPVVAFDCIAGPSEMITDGVDGYLVPLFDYKMFGEKLLTLMNDPVLREQFGNEAKSSIDRFSVKKIGEKYYSFITSSL